MKFFTKNTFSKKIGGICANAVLAFVALFASAAFAVADTQNAALQTQKTGKAFSPLSLQTSPKMRRETVCVVFCMEKGHYLKMPLSELDMREFVREYMQNLDFFKLFFTAEDVQYFQDFFSSQIEIMLRQGTLLPAFSIYERFLERADSRVEWIRERMQKPFDLDTSETFRPDRSKEDWPANSAECDNLWEKRLKYDIENQLLGYGEDDEESSQDADTDSSRSAADAGASQQPAAQPNAIPVRDVSSREVGASENSATEAADAQAEGDTKVVEPAPKKAETFEQKLERAKSEVLKRYEALVKNYAKSDAMEIQEVYLNSLAHLYDPHTAFLSEYSLEEFDIAVRNSLVGIGAVLRDKDGYCEIMELTPGGPAERSKMLDTGDKIVAVAQGDGDFEDVIGLKLRNTVRKIRGKAGSKVRLLIEPSGKTGARKSVTLVREEIKLTTKLAKAAVYQVVDGNKTVPVGVVDLPAFYGDSEGSSDSFSTSRDVEELLLKLKKAGVKGVVLDLRRNGGGFLGEAVDLAGLFVKTGPVVQVRDAAGRTNRLRDDNEKLVWDGPLVVLVSRLSASASEIVAGALQNERRALIVGDKSTHGKGTVQAVYNLQNFDPAQKSAAKVTIQKWYAPSGDSIQLKGIHSDIVLPSIYDYMDLGEASKDYAMRWDSISADDVPDLSYCVSAEDAPYLVERLKSLSQARQKSSGEFKVLNERIDRFKTRKDEKDVSLNFAAREKTLADDDAFFDRIKEELKALSKNNYQKTEILLDSAKDAPKDVSAQNSDKKRNSHKKRSLLDSEDGDDEDGLDFDVQLREALRITADWVEALENPELLEPFRQASKGSVPAHDAEPAASAADAAEVGEPAEVAQ